MITSASNPRLKLVRRLESRRQRERLGLFACEGEDLVAAALDAGLEPVEALVDGERPALLERLPRHELVAPALLGEAASLAHPPRVVALFRTADLPRGPLPPVGLALWRVGDPGNVGTLVRAADALGPAFVALSSGSADPMGSKATRAAMGAVFRVPLVGFD
ncbi:MAG: RNA methyltransferase, partial [Actinomycetota bacterium]|nr:RNA methyltransferase [Actinomycetota bacterium]